MAFEKAYEYSSVVIVETFQEGNDYRILVVDGKVVAAAERVPGHVVGDGRHTVAELVEIVNQDPRRGVGHEKVLTRLEFDHQAERLLEQAGLAPDAVLPEGQVFYLRSTGNLSTGGTSVDKTDVIHYDNRIMAERAVKAIGLDVGGVDFISPDISRSHKQVGGAIVEVNAAPGFRMHIAPTEGKAARRRRPGDRHALPARGRRTASRSPPSPAPTARRRPPAWSGTSSSCPATRVGMTTTDGVYIDGELTVSGDMTGPWASHLVLRDPTVDAAVLETARGGIVRAGLGWRKCKVGAVLNVASDHLGMGGVKDLDELAEVKRVVVEVAQDCVRAQRRRRAGGADGRAQPGQADLRDHATGRTISCAGTSASRRAGRWRWRRGSTAGMIVLYDGEEQIPLLWARQIPATVEGHAIHNVQNAMFATAIAHAMGISLENIRQGLRTFTTDFFQTPGRHELLQRASVPGAARLRPQRPRHDGDGADDPRADRQRPAASASSPPRATAGTRTSASSPAPPPRPSTSSSCARTTTCGAAGAGRPASCSARG